MLTTPSDRTHFALSAAGASRPQPADPQRRPYATPALVELGSVADLTQGANTGGPPEPTASGV